MKKIYPLILMFQIIFLSWSIGFAAQKEIPRVEIDEDGTQTLVFDVPNHKIELPHFLKKVQEHTPSRLTVTSATCFLTDLRQDGNEEILSLAQFPNRLRFLMIFDTKGNFLASKDAGLGSDLFFGVQRKGLPLIFGYKNYCAASAGGCDWEFDIWSGAQITKVLDATTHYGKEGPGNDPVIKYVPEKDTLQVVTDDGKIFWDKTQMTFAGKWQRLDEDETLGDCPPVDKKLSVLEKGKFYFRRKEYDCAKKAYVLAIDGTKNNYEAWQYLGYESLTQGKKEYAITCLTTAVSLNPNYAMGHYNLALAYWENGEKTEAVNELRILYGLDPKYKKLVPDDTQFKEIITDPDYKTMVGSL